jgi:hypothetical protein
MDSDLGSRVKTVLRRGARVQCGLYLLAPKVDIVSNIGSDWNYMEVRKLQYTSRSKMTCDIDEA